VGAGPGGGVRAYVVCGLRDDIGRVEVAPCRLRQWVAEALGVAQRLAALIQSSPCVEECVAGRLWWIGRPRLADRPVDMFLAHGATWADAGEVFTDCGRLRECANPLILVPSEVPTGAPFGPGARVQSLVRLLSIEDGGLRLDMGALEDAMGAAAEVQHQDRRPQLCIDGANVEYRGQHVRLGPIALALLTCLARTPGRLKTHEVIADEVWGDDGTRYDHQIRRHVSALNAEFGRVDKGLSSDAAPHAPALIASTRGVGYLLRLPPHQVSCR
jgi:DNA-binding winged helix-turn-helix (wHTH) protein